MDHEAGYDSLLTAQIFIKLSAQLRDGGASKYYRAASTDRQPRAKQWPSLRTRFDLLERAKTTDTFSSSIPAETSPQTKKKVETGQLIPRFDAKFWKIYGNRLRVFGTEERMCVME